MFFFSSSRTSRSCLCEPLLEMGCDRQQEQQQHREDDSLVETFPALYDHNQAEAEEDEEDATDQTGRRGFCYFFHSQFIGTGSIFVWLIAPSLLWIYVALSFWGVEPPVTQGLTWTMVNVSILMFMVSAFWFQRTAMHSGRKCLLMVEDNDHDDEDDDHHYLHQDNNYTDQPDSSTYHYNQMKRLYILIPELAIDVVLALVLLGQERLAFQILLSTSIGLLSMLLACYVLRKCYPEQEEDHNKRSEKVCLYRGSSLRPEDGLTPTVMV